MKRIFRREIMLLAWPVLFIGAAGFLASRSNREMLPAWMRTNPLIPGPIRVEFSPLQPIAVTPFDAADGYEWAATTTASRRGAWNMPPGWKVTGGSTSSLSRGDLVYRRGKHWKIAPRRREDRLGEDRLGEDRPVVTANLNGDTNLTTLKVDLDGVPRDADEVRLRGEFSSMEFYSGVIPRGWTPPPNLRNGGTQRILTLTSKPFDIAIKAPGEKWPVFACSHIPGLKLQSVHQKWLHQFSNLKGPSARWMVQARFVPLKTGEMLPCWAEKTTITDANGGNVYGG